MRPHERAIAVDAAACLALLSLLLGGASVYATWRESSASGFDQHASEYSSLVHHLGAHDADSVDAPPREQSPRLTLARISSEATRLAAHVRDVHLRTAGDRATALARQLDAVALRADHLDGRALSFSEEVQRLLGAEWSRAHDDRAPEHDRAHLRRLLPGEEPLWRRLSTYQRRFIVSRGRLSDVVTRAVAACRAKTKRYLQLPDRETVDIEYVADRPWSAYSLYRGGYRSTIQINRVFPRTVDQILTLACHEGYPGHHVYNVLRDRDIVRARGWLEASVLPVFSPEGFGAEAVATAAGALAFSRDERVALFRDDLFPASDLDAGDVERYVDVNAAVDRLAAEISDVVVDYLQGRIGGGDAARALRERALMEHPESTLAFVDRYRAYALAYTVGRKWLQLDTGASAADSWATLARIMGGAEAFRASDRSRADTPESSAR